MNDWGVAKRRDEGESEWEEDKVEDEEKVIKRKSVVLHVDRQPLRRFPYKQYECFPE